jgi:predicted AAA+ superfamily ATPase
MWNNAFVHSALTTDFDAAIKNPEWWGYVVENAICAHILNNFLVVASDLYYWRRRDDEIDFVVSSPGNLWGIEVKSSRMKNPKGLSASMRHYPRAKPFIVGGSGMPLEEFFLTDPKSVFA